MFFDNNLIKFTKTSKIVSIFFMGILLKTALKLQDRSY